MESLSVCSKECKIMRFADDDMYMDVCTCTHYDVIIVCKKLIFYISEIVLAPTILDMRGSTVAGRLLYTLLFRPNGARRQLL